MTAQRSRSDEGLAQCKEVVVALRQPMSYANAHEGVNLRALDASVSF